MVPQSDAPSTTTTAIATRNTGSARRVLMMNMITWSVRPPKYPATRPRDVPMMAEISMTDAPISRETCAP